VLLKNKNLLNVDPNKYAYSCDPCLDDCKRVNEKINGRKLSDVNGKEIKEFLIFFPSNCS